MPMPIPIPVPVPVPVPRPIPGTDMSAGPDKGDAAPPDPATLPSRRERVRRWFGERRNRIDEARESSTTVGLAFDALSYDTDTGAPVLAAALGFRVFLFQGPY